MKASDNLATRRTFLAAGLAAGALAWRGASAANDPLGLPAGNATIVVPFTPGTTPDLIARLLSPVLAERSGHAFVVENREGASGIIGLSAVTNAAPNGLVIASSTNTSLTLPLVYAKVPFDVLSGFTPLAMIGSINFALCVHPSTGIATMAQFIDYAKRNPGKLNYGSPGKGTFHHLCMEMLMGDLGLDLTHVPYKGSAGATTDLLAGHIQAMFLPMHIAAPFAADKRTVILGASHLTQDPNHPGVAPLATLGVPGYDADSWYAFWGPKGMKSDLVARYNAEINLALEQGKVKADLTKNGVVPMPMSPQALGELAKAEFAKWKKVAQAANIQPE